MTRSDRDNEDHRDVGNLGRAALSVTATADDEWVVVAVHGEVDISTATTLDEALQRATASSARVVIDLSGVAFMDSTGLGVLMRAHKRQDDAGAALRIAAPSDRVTRLLDVTKLDDVFAVYPSVDESRAAPLPGQG
jgi:anti-sigma B factor antagonist